MLLLLLFDVVVDDDVIQVECWARWVICEWEVVSGEEVLAVVVGCCSGVVKVGDVARDVVM